MRRRSGTICAVVKGSPRAFHTSTSASTRRETCASRWRSRGDAQTLGSDREDRIVDRLDVDAAPVQQEIACRLAAVLPRTTSRHITLDYLEQLFLALWDSAVAGLQMIRETPEMDSPNCVLAAAFGHKQHFAELDHSR
jgi:hypothetical protein